MSDLGNKDIFAKNLKYYMDYYEKDRTKICDDLDIPYTTFTDWYNAKTYPRIDKIELLANYFDIKKSDLIENKYKDINFDNAEIVDIDSDIVKIPVYGTIKAGVPLECQSDIIDYIEIPKRWTRGNKVFYGLELSGDSMYPKYNDKDIVIFEKNNDVQSYNGKDVAVMINRTESTFKKILVNEQGIILQPYNADYDIMMFSKEQVEELPITVIGIARERRTKIE